MIKLSVENPTGISPRTFRDNIVTIGRSRDCDLSFPDAKGVSRFHCRIVMDGGTCFIEDLGSRNHSLVNGKPVSRGVVRVGDQLTLGTVRLSVDSLRTDEQTEEFVQPCLHCGRMFARRKAECPRCGTEVRSFGRSRSIDEYAFTGYRLVRRLGSGGMGIVFEAEEVGTEDSRRVALKVLRPHLARNAAYLARFIEEIRLLTSLRHPGIVSVYGRGREDDLQFLIMELVGGRSARVATMETGHLPWESATRIVWQVTRALDAAYRQAGIVHGDLKPGNFLLDENGRVKLCDFGLAQVDLKRRGPSRDHAVEAERRGTAAYAAPERFSEEGISNVASDIYSLGVSLYQMATGQLPFKAGSVHAFCQYHRKEPVPEMAAIREGINPALQLLVERMMAKRPEDRYPDHASLIEDLGFLLH